MAVATSSQPRTIKLLRGDGNGAFQSPSSTTVIGEPMHIAAGEFNGDAYTDLAVSVQPNSTGPSSVSIFLGGAAGTFTASGNLPAGNKTRFAAVGDLNGDGRADLAAVDQGTFLSDVDPGGVFVFLGKGDGTFQSGVRYGGGLNPTSAAIGDLNQDGVRDVAITTSGPSFSSRVGILLGQGAGLLSEPSFQTVGDGQGDVAIGDFDQDGKNDLLVAHCCGSVTPAILRGAGNGTFAAEEFFPAVGDASQAAVADFNGDGYPDAAFASNANISSGGAMAVLYNLLGPGPSQAVATSVNGAGFQPGLAVAPDSIVSAFGEGLATGTAHASTIPLPTSMLGTSVTVRDSQGVSRDAGLITVTPGQVNYVMPVGTAAGLANLTVNSGTGATIQGTVQVATTGPGIFKASPTTLAVGSALRIQPGDVRTETGLVRFENGQYVPQPVNLGNAPDQVLLILYGTGIRGRNKSNPATATVGGEPATVDYADDQKQFVGLDQVVILVPRSMAGRGLVDVVVTVDGKTANVVQVSFQ
jgi:uncharacterized protein (TIGR03437 family)